MSEKQRTLAAPAAVSGTGLHTGKQVTLTYLPAPENHGYKFKRTDIEGQPVIEADVDLVVDTSRGTSIEKNGVRISTIEHCLAALAGLGVDNALIEIDGPETPILDGSANIFAESILKSGIVKQDAEREYYEITSNISYSYPDKKVEMIALPSEEFEVSVMIDFETKVLGTQNARMRHMADFKDQIAPCRTFVFLHELEYLLSNDLIKGGDMSNAIVFVNRVISPEELDRLAGLFNKPSVEVRKEGVLNNIDLYFPNEPARHKLLDVIGDLALAGRPLKGHIIAMRPGHFTNVEFARMIKKQMQQDDKKKKALPYDLNKPPLYDINQIKKILPHRPPFLLIDKILEMSEEHIVGLKNVTMNEHFFVGHFPEEPVMPGVLQIEAMAQTGGVLVLSTVPDPENYVTYFLKIDKAKFRKKVVPGDTLIFVLKLSSPIRRGICHMHGTAFVGNKIVMEADMVAQIIKKEKE